MSIAVCMGCLCSATSTFRTFSQPLWFRGERGAMEKNGPSKSLENRPKHPKLSAEHGCAKKSNIEAYIIGDRVVFQREENIDCFLVLRIFHV